MDSEHLPSFSLAGRVALVTGANRGIGRGLVDALASAGATVAVTTRSYSSADAVAAEMLAAQAAGRVMVAQGSGRIVAISSQASLVGIRDHALYCASDAAAMVNGTILPVDGGWTAQ